MYSYSPIKSIQVKNFRNIGEAVIDFTESPIVSLIGENESGKTSIVKAFGVCAMHADPRSQKDYIRDGTTGFGVAIELQDGTQIIRMKTGTANRYVVKKPDGTMWDASKLEHEVPKAVQEVMGMIEEPETKEPLHIRTYEDQLLFVVTPASTNYKVMYDALKISQITKAIKAGSVEANSLKAKIGDTDTSIATLRGSLARIKTFDIEPLLNIRNKLSGDLRIVEKLDAISSLIDDIEKKKKQLGALELLESSGISEIDTAEVMRLDSIGRVLSEIDTMRAKESAYREIISAEEVDVATLAKINTAYDKVVEIEAMSKRAEIYEDIVGADSISEFEISAFSRLDDILTQQEKYQRLLGIYNFDGISEVEMADLTAIDKLTQAIGYTGQIQTWKSEYEQYTAYINSVENWMKQIGVATADCPKCGEAVIIDRDLLND